MNRGLLGLSAASAIFVISLSCEIAAAAEPGFYIGAAGGRSEQRLDKQAGVGPPIPVAVIGFLPPGTIIVPAPPGSQPPPFAFPPVIGAVSGFVPLLGPDTSVDETDVGWNFALGYRVNKYLAAELSYVDAGEASMVERYSVPPTSTLPDVLRTYTVNARGPEVSVLGSLPLSERWELFLRGGVLFAKQEVESRTIIESPTATGGQPIKRDFSDEVITVGAGVQWAFLPRWTARLEYQRSDDLQPNEIMGESRLDQASISVLFGL